MELQYQENEFSYILKPTKKAAKQLRAIAIGTVAVFASICI